MWILPAPWLFLQVALARANAVAALQLLLCERAAKQKPRRNDGESMEHLLAALKLASGKDEQNKVAKVDGDGPSSALYKKMEAQCTQKQTMLNLMMQKQLQSSSASGSDVVSVASEIHVPSTVASTPSISEIPGNVEVFGEDGTPSARLVDQSISPNTFFSPDVVAWARAWILHTQHQSSSTPSERADASVGKFGIGSQQNFYSQDSG